MKKFSCPHCKKSTISLWQKWKISPLSDSRCEACGSKLSTRYAWEIFARSPIILSCLLLAFRVVSSDWGSFVVLFGVAFIVMLLIQTFVVPIVATNNSSEAQRV
jgi:DNA-directed RNA polymerase subunit RPC12/RpoP